MIHFALPRILLILGFIQDTRWREMYHYELFWLANYFVHAHLGDAIKVLFYNNIFEFVAIV